MKSDTLMPNKKPIRACALAVAAILAATANAQSPQPGFQAPAQGYPQPAPQYAPQQPLASGAARPNFFRELFAGTLAAVVQTATGGLLGAVNGRLTDWFARKGGAQAQGYNAAAPGYPAQPAYPAPQPAYTPAPQAYPASPYPTNTDPAATGAYPPPPAQGQVSAYPAPTAGYPPADPNAANPYNTANPYGAPAAPQIYDASTGQLVSDSANNPYAAAPAAGNSSLYAGIAYEVYAIDANGSAMPVNAATHQFRTGDKFKVYYRPSLPGRMEVYNVNPAGRQSLIDVSNMAAGQLTELGPYQFTNATGDESLRLVLSPCSNSQLLATSRDIVRADSVQPGAYPGAAPTAGGGVQLANCGAPTTRGLKRVTTRDIEKVAVDGGTSYALDPVSQQEQSSGRMEAREVTIVFRHR